MITEDYVSFETAKLLKEKGFKGSGSHFYEKGRLVDFHNYWWRITPKERYEAIEAPTLQMTMKWLREKNIIIVIQPEYFNVESKCSAWSCDVWAGDNYEKLQGNFPTYEEACEAAIKYCLENLI